MGHNIDLSKYKTRTDLAIEAIANKSGITSNVYEIDNIKITEVYIDSKTSKKINCLKLNFC